MKVSRNLSRIEYDSQQGEKHVNHVRQFSIDVPLTNVRSVSRLN